ARASRLAPPRRLGPAAQRLDPRPPGRRIGRGPFVLGGCRSVVSGDRRGVGNFSGVAGFVALDDGDGTDRESNDGEYGGDGGEHAQPAGSSPCLGLVARPLRTAGLDEALL